MIIPLTREWRDRDLARRLEIWAPRIGERAATTYAQGVHILDFTLVGIAGSMVVAAASGVIGFGDSAFLVLLAICWVPIVGGLIYTGKVMYRGAHQAAEVVATKDVVVPIQNVAQFERWRATNKYSRFRESS